MEPDSQIAILSVLTITSRKNYMSRILVCALAAVFCMSDPLRAQTNTGDTATLGSQLRGFDALLLQAEQQRDTMTILHLIAPDFLWVSFSGGFFGRSGRVSAVTRGVRTVATPEMGASRAQWVTRDVAMLVSTQRQELGHGAERRPRDVRTTGLYRRRDNRWELVGQFATQVALPNP